MSKAQKVAHMESLKEQNLKESQFIPSLKVARRSELAAFADALQEEGLLKQVFDDADLFTSIIDLATSDYGVEQKAIAAHLGVSPAAVARWRTGESIPRPYAREAVVSTVSSLVRERLVEFH